VKKWLPFEEWTEDECLSRLSDFGMSEYLAQPNWNWVDIAHEASRIFDCEPDSNLADAFSNVAAAIKNQIADTIGEALSLSKSETEDLSGLLSCDEDDYLEKLRALLGKKCAH